MKLIIGLGNPGKKYERTRHNAGWLFLDSLAAGARWQKSGRGQAEYIKMELAGVPVELLKPQTYMNSSGRAVHYAAKKHGLKAGDIIVVHDDKDIPFGQFRVQTGRGAAGHNGVASIIEHLGTKNFTRLRLGVAPTDMPIANTTEFVLQKFSAAEQKALPAIFADVERELERLLQTS